MSISIFVTYQVYIKKVYTFYVFNNLVYLAFVLAIRHPLTEVVLTIHQLLTSLGLSRRTREARGEREISDVRGDEGESHDRSDGEVHSYQPPVGRTLTHRSAANQTMIR
eukprot:GHVN01100658.1.p1 GENE.GHVN01100658.1~~GHVN01100658.1.p1  ORF type:complete len:109 (+),score=14.33 GHVN01100658.1:1133-1459(+)